MRSGDLSRDPRLTKEQEATRRRGLRILARMIVRAHLASLIEGRRSEQRPWLRGWHGPDPVHQREESPEGGRTCPVRAPV